MGVFFKDLKTALLAFVFFTVLTGFLYPMMVYFLGNVLFPNQANGSLIVKNGKVIGSKWIGQAFSSPGYFWSRPSATDPFPYNAENSSGSNLSQTNPLLKKLVKNRVTYLKSNGGFGLVPVDLVTTSASGLDPDISPDSAYYQVQRISKYRHIPAEKIHLLIDSTLQKRTFGILGEPRVNVLELNLALDQLNGSQYE